MIEKENELYLTIISINGDDSESKHILRVKMLEVRNRMQSCTKHLNIDICY